MQVNHHILAVILAISAVEKLLVVNLGLECMGFSIRKWPHEISGQIP